MIKPICVALAVVLLTGCSTVTSGRGEVTTWSVGKAAQEYVAMVSPADADLSTLNQLYASNTGTTTAWVQICGQLVEDDATLARELTYSPWPRVAAGPALVLAHEVEIQGQAFGQCAIASTVDDARQAAGDTPNYDAQIRAMRESLGLK